MKQEPGRDCATRYEQLDDTPVAVPVNMTNQPLSLREEMQRYVQSAISAAAAQQDFETFEEFDDFHVDDELPDLTTVYSVVEPVINETLDGTPAPGDQVVGGQPEPGQPAPAGAEVPENVRQWFVDNGWTPPNPAPPLDDPSGTA